MARAAAAPAFPDTRAPARETLEARLARELLEAQDVAVRVFTSDLLSLNRQHERVETSIYGDRSSADQMGDHIRLGILGTGCRGTKGVGRKSESGPDEAPGVDPIAQARYDRLSGDDLTTADAVIADGRGDQLAEIDAGARRVEASLNARIGFALAGAKQRRAWALKIAAGDSAPALAGAEERGRARLVRAAAAWWKEL